MFEVMGKSSYFFNLFKLIKMPIIRISIEDIFGYVLNLDTYHNILHIMYIIFLKSVFALNSK